MSEDQPVFVQLRRKDPSVQWGFRMNGGRDQGSILYIQKLSRNGVGDRSGLRPGDGILKINNVPATYLDHEQAKMEIIRSGNELDFVVQRDAIDVGQHRGAQTKPAPKQRSEVDEEPSMYKGYTNPSVQSRSFKILQQSLNYSEAPQGNHHLNSNDLQEEGGFGYCTNVAPTLIVKRAKESD
ncbi:Hypothetical predicted protein [Mytilus galloprovincialis]|uniref:PDZ domain-containing protein n=1 Tax=Mytilus galloprovincialis TaxID=29158 RepID=A0A8B6H0F4_MYTGA|nr:Hypothetical predicted protein [Mytilus galloprovincialis]